jgi:hypothetical protein
MRSRNLPADGSSPTDYGTLRTGRSARNRLSDLNVEAASTSACIAEDNSARRILLRVGRAG